MSKNIEAISLFRIEAKKKEHEDCENEEEEEHRVHSWEDSETSSSSSPNIIYKLHQLKLKL